MREWWGNPGRVGARLTAHAADDDDNGVDCDLDVDGDDNGDDRDVDDD